MGPGVVMDISEESRWVLEQLWTFQRQVKCVATAYNHIQPTVWSLQQWSYPDSL
jgi:hypothetical protein